MAYVRSKMIHGNGPYYYLVKSERVGTKVKQTHIAYLGKNPSQKSGTATNKTLENAGQDYEMETPNYPTNPRTWTKDEQDAHNKNFNESMKRLDNIIPDRDRWLKEKGIKNMKEYKKLPEKKQDELQEEYSIYREQMSNTTKKQDVKTREIEKNMETKGHVVIRKEHNDITGAEYVYYRFKDDKPNMERRTTVFQDGSATAS